MAYSLWQELREEQMAYSQRTKSLWLLAYGTRFGRSDFVQLAISYKP